MSNESNGTANGAPVASAAKPVTTENSVEVPKSSAAETTLPSSAPKVDTEEEEVDDEEENLFATLEKEKEKEEAEEAAHPHAPPTDIKAAPKLLQDLLKSGAIKLPDAGVAKVANGHGGSGTVSSEATGGEEKKNEDGDTKAVPAVLEPEKVSLVLSSAVLWFEALCGVMWVG